MDEHENRYENKREQMRLDQYRSKSPAESYRIYSQDAFGCRAFAESLIQQTEVGL